MKLSQRTPSRFLALTETKLPERPDYERVNGFLIKARRHLPSRPSLLNCGGTTPLSR